MTPNMGSEVPESTWILRQAGILGEPSPSTLKLREGRGGDPGPGLEDSKAGSSGFQGSVRALSGLIPRTPRQQIRKIGKFSVLAPRIPIPRISDRTLSFKPVPRSPAPNPPTKVGEHRGTPCEGVLWVPSNILVNGFRRYPRTPSKSMRKKPTHSCKGIAVLVKRFW